MSIEKALQILKLNANFTEEELRKSYLSLAKAYHPDALVGKSPEEIKLAEEKMKEVNEAYEFLKKAIKKSYTANSSQPNASSNGTNYTNVNHTTTNTTNSNYDNHSDFEQYKASKIDIMYQYLATINKYEKLDFSSYNYDDLLLLATISIKGASSKSEIDNAFSAFDKKFKNILKEAYFKKHNLPSDANFVFNDKLSLDEFYKSLERFKLVYDSILLSLNNFVEPYKNDAYYIKVAKDVEHFKQETLNHIMAINWANGNSAQNEAYNWLNKFKQKIDNIFKVGAINKELYSELVDMAKDCSNLLLITKVQQLEYLLDDKLFYIKYQEVKQEIENYRDKIAYKDEIKRIKDDVNSKFDKAISKCFNRERKTLLYRLHDRVKSFITLFTMTYTVSLETFRLIDEIDLNDLEKADKIIKNATNNLITNKNVSVGILIDSPEPILEKSVRIDDAEYTIPIEGQGNNIYENYNDSRTKLSLDEFMENAEEFFVTSTWNNENLIALYKLGDIVLCIYNGRLEFFQNIQLSNVEGQSKNPFSKYQDKDYVKSLIINQCYKDIELVKEKMIKNGI